MQALCGAVVPVPHIDKRVTQLTVKDVIRPGSTRRLQGEGLPLPKDPLRRGDLVVEFDILFPDKSLNSIAETDKKVLAKHLPRILK